MATLLRNFHPYTRAPQRPARFVCGAVLALAGFALLAGQLLAALADSADVTAQAADQGYTASVSLATPIA